MTTPGKKEIVESQRLPILNNLQILDNREVNLATEEHRPGMICRTCRYYQLECPLEENVHPDKKKPIITPNPEEEASFDDPHAEAVNNMFLEGVCTRHQGYLLTHVPDNYSCPYYNERHPHLQFYDTELKDGDDHDLALASLPLGHPPGRKVWT